MTFLDFKGKQYEIKFTYKALRRIEAHFEEPVVNIFSGMAGVTDLEILPVLLWATIGIKEEEFRNWSVGHFEEYIEEAIEEGELNFRQSSNIMMAALQESTIVQQMLGLDIKEDGEVTTGK